MGNGEGLYESYLSPSGAHAGLSRLPVRAPMRCRTACSMSMDMSSLSSPSSLPSSLLLADYKSTVEELVQGLGNTPWLQVFIPTSIGMVVGLTICFILYISAQPSYDLDEFEQQRQGKKN